MSKIIAFPSKTADDGDFLFDSIDFTLPFVLDEPRYVSVAEFSMIEDVDVDSVNAVILDKNMLNEDGTVRDVMIRCGMAKRGSGEHSVDGHGGPVTRWRHDALKLFYDHAWRPAQYMASQIGGINDIDIEVKRMLARIVDMARHAIRHCVIENSEDPEIARKEKVVREVRQPEFSRISVYFQHLPAEKWASVKDDVSERVLMVLPLINDIDRVEAMALYRKIACYLGYLDIFFYKLLYGED